MSDLARRLGHLEDQMVRLHVDRQMVSVERFCVAEGISEAWLPELRRGLEDTARWMAVHAPLTPEALEAEIQRVAQQKADDFGITAAQLIAEAERIATASAFEG